MKILSLTLFISILIISVYSTTDNSHCGKVYDGLTNGRFDLSIQTSISTIAANWDEFGDDVLFYEWAIVSDNIRLPFTTEDRCAEKLKILPDILHWKSVKKQSSAVQSDLSLKVGTTYYALVRVTYPNGQQIVASSDGVTVVSTSSLPEDMKQNVKSTNNNIHSESMKRDTTSTSTTSSFSSSTTGGVDSTTQKYIRRGTNLISSDSCFVYSDICEIDNENRCRQSKLSVHDYLNQIYGKAVFPNEDQEFFYQPKVRVFNGFFVIDDDGADDDEGGAPAWVLAPIIGFIFGLFLLALCCVFLVICLCCALCGDNEERENQSEIGVIHDNDEGKDYGNREKKNIEANTATKVEFPDTNIRRLSVDHNDEEVSESEVKGTRRKHPIKTSESSSFRDYRSVNN